MINDHGYFTLLLLHLAQMVLGLEHQGLVLVLNREHGKRPGVHDLEGPVLHVGLHSGVSKLASNQPLCVEDGVRWVDRHLKCTIAVVSIQIMPLESVRLQMPNIG